MMWHSHILKIHLLHCPISFGYIRFLAFSEDWIHLWALTSQPLNFFQESMQCGTMKVHWLGTAFFNHSWRNTQNTLKFSATKFVSENFRWPNAALRAVTAFGSHPLRWSTSATEPHPYKWTWMQAKLSRHWVCSDCSHGRGHGWAGIPSPILRSRVTCSHCPAHTTSNPSDRIAIAMASTSVPLALSSSPSHALLSHRKLTIPLNPPARRRRSSLCITACRFLILTWFSFLETLVAGEYHIFH